MKVKIETIDINEMENFADGYIDSLASGQLFCVGKILLRLIMLMVNLIWFFT